MARPHTLFILFQEHILIQEVISLLQKIASSKKSISSALIEKIVDFFKTFADQNHHGKEEDILFKAAQKKELSPSLKKTLAELYQEHKVGRSYISELSQLKEEKKIYPLLQQIITLYTQHIEKENRHFFVPILEYFSDAELDQMLKEFKAFDEKMIHKKYTKVKDEIAELLFPS